MEKLEMINPTELKAGMCVLCTQKDNGKQFIGKIQKVDGNTVHFDYTLRDDGTTSEYCKGEFDRFVFDDCSMFEDVANFIRKLTMKQPEVETPTEPSILNSNIKKVPFNLDKWKEGQYPLMTKDNRNVRYVTSDVKSDFPNLMLLECNDGETPVCYTNDGIAGIPGETTKHSDLDLFMLVEKPKPITQYVRLYRRDNTGTTFVSQLVDDPKDFDNIEIPIGCSVVSIVPITY